MEHWLFWTCCGFLFLILELFTPGALLFVSIASGFFVMALAMLVEVSSPVVLTFLWGATVFVGFGVIRFFLKKSKLSISEVRSDASNIFRFSGMSVVVVKKISVNSYKVLVGAEEWSAKPLQGEDLFEIGEEVYVSRVVGNTLLVKKI